MPSCADECVDDGLLQTAARTCPVITGGDDGPTSAGDDAVASDDAASESSAGTADDDGGTGSGDGGSGDGASGSAGSDGADDEGSGETSPATTQWCVDADEDGHGDPQDCVDVPDGNEPPAGSVPNDDDCDDADGQAYPGAAAEEPELCAIDADGDGWGDDTPPAGVDAGSDCRDDNPDAYPGAAVLDDPAACMEDADGDGWGDSDPPAGAVPGLDCDDADPEVPDAAACIVWCLDADGDGYGDPGQCVFDDTPPDDHVGNGSDCDDDNAAAFPGAAQIEDDDACMEDEDDDGYGDADPPPGVAAGADCDDLIATLVDQCVECVAGATTCQGDDIFECNDNGTFEVQVGHCTYGCNDAMPSCWSALDVDAHDVACVDVLIGQTLQLDSTVTGGDGDYEYSWTPAASFDDASSPDPTASPDGVETYTLTVTDGEGNAGADDVTVHVAGQPIDLADDCEVFTLPDPWPDLSPPPDYVFSEGGTVVCNDENAIPSVLVCSTVYENVELRGTFEVQAQDMDDDAIGFVWGWQDEEHFYILSWKRTTQDTFAFGQWFAGITIKRVQADAGPLTANDVLQQQDTANSAVLATPATFHDEGWEPDTQYRITLDYGSPITTITIQNLETGTVVASGSVNDATYPSGRFGTFDASQLGACSGPWTSRCP